MNPSLTVRGTCGVTRQPNRIFVSNGPGHPPLAGTGDKLQANIPLILCQAPKPDRAESRLKSLGATLIALC